MALIDRVELAAYHDSSVWLSQGRNHDKWRPEFLDTRLNFQGDSSIVAGVNGSGKSTTARAMLAVLSRSSKLIEIVKGRMAPQVFGHFSHIRMEIVDVGASKQVNVFQEQHGRKPGKRYVFGMYGNYAGNVNFYHYEGELDDCPVSYRNGFEVAIVKNEDFQKNLEMVVKKKGGKIGSSPKEWRDYIGNFFEMKLIDQIAKYQTSGGGEGDNKRLINVTRTSASFDRDLFFQYVAPEFLPDAMSEFGGRDEEAIEYAVVNSLRSLFTARYAAKEKARHLEGVQQRVDSLRSINETAKELIEERIELIKAQNNFLGAYSKLKYIAHDSGLPGIPPIHLPNDPLVAKIANAGHLVLQGHGLYIMDKGLAEIIGEEPKHTNERAGKDLPSEICQITEVIDIPIDLKFSRLQRDQRGNPNKLYPLDSALKILTATTRSFSPDWTKEKAIAAVIAAFEWAETNDIRRKIAKLNKLRADNKETSDQTIKDLETLGNDKKDCDGQLAIVAKASKAYDAMCNAGFTENELSDPLAAKRTLEDEKEQNAVASRENGIRLTQIQTGQNALAEFRNTHPELAPADYLRKRDGLRMQLNQGITRYQDELIPSLQAQKDEVAGQITSVIGEKSANESLLAKIGIYAESAAKYTEIFGEENPEGLEKKVEDAYNNANKEISKASEGLAYIKEKLEALSSFRQIYPQEDPRIWIETRTQEKRQLETNLESLNIKLEALKVEKSYADNFKVAPGEHFERALKIAGANAETVYEAVLSFNLEKVRERVVLSVFSALLFSPVFKSAEDAIRVAAEIDAAKLDCPVFVLEELRDFCVKASIHVDGNGVHALLAGTETEKVASILDPRRIENRKAELTDEINSAQGDISEINNSITAINSADGKKAERIANLAIQAIEESLEQKEKDLLSAKAEAQRILPEVKRRHNEKHLIKEKIEFSHLGGHAKINDIEETLEALRQKISELEAERTGINTDIQKAQESLKTLRAKYAESNNKENCHMEDLAKPAAAFLEIGGEEALKRCKEKENTLKDQVERIHKKLYFAPEFTDPFTMANLFVKDNGPKEKAKLESRIKEITETIEKKKGEQKKYTSEMETLGQEVEGLREILYRYSSQITNILKRYRAIRKAAAELGLVNVETMVDSEFAERVAATANSRHDFEKLLSSVSDVADVISEIEAAALAKDVESAREAEKKASNLFHESLIFMLTPRVGYDRSTIPAIIGTQLQNALDNGRPELVEAIFNQFCKDLEDARREFEDANKTISKVRTDFSEGIANLTILLRHNFKLCCKTMSPDDDGGAGFIIKADIVREDARSEIIERIVTHLEDKYGPRVESGPEVGAALKGEKETKQEDRKMVEYVKEEFYKNMFIEPSIKVKFPGIAGSEPFQLTAFSNDDGPSGGESDAILLLWLVKFGDFIIKRGEESEANASDAARRRQIEKAIAQQRRRHRVYIIDGIFAKLRPPYFGCRRGLNITSKLFSSQNLFRSFPLYQLALSVYMIIFFVSPHIFHSPTTPTLFKNSCLGIAPI